MKIQPQKLEYTCPRGRRTSRTVSNTGTYTLRCTCGCGSSYKFTLQ